MTLAALLARAHASVTLLARDEAEAAAVSALRGIARLPEIALPPSVAVVPAAAAPQSLDGLVIAVPAQALRASVGDLPLSRSIPILSAAKGLELRSGMRMSEVLLALGWAPALIAAVSGPNLAHEIARGLPAATVVASPSERQAAAWQQALSSGAFRAYRTTDITGVELGGALKNVIAVAAGAAAGLGLGANAVAAIMTRGLAEMTRLGVALGADPATFLGLAGVGDLAATCYSPLSRNRRLGELVATGRTAEAALAEIGEAVEGASTAPVALELARRVAVELPIGEQVAAVLAGQTGIEAAITFLLSRALKSESSPPGADAKLGE